VNPNKPIIWLKNKQTKRDAEQHAPYVVMLTHKKAVACLNKKKTLTGSTAFGRDKFGVND
jgi:hypothetical protein